ncbi:MAG: hypothetical protein KIS92_00185 [Planctomycetota bacterium]|nr:hypothetical protein [Planctomycetota bacterium]
MAASGDPQVKSDHPWYPGELSCSTFERLFKTEADLYKRVTGKDVKTDEDKALAAWFWRNLNHAHADDAKCDYFGTGFGKTDNNREFWRGHFGYGFSLCFTTHAQWCGEMEKLLGHCRARAVGVPGHTSFEVYLTGGPYGEGKWVLLDHDISTVIFKEDGSELLSIKEIDAEFDKYTNAGFKPERQRGWKVGGLHDKDPQAYDDFKNVSYEFGYYGPPPMVSLRTGETLRRYINPGLEDGKTFVFWGMNYMCKGAKDAAEIPGPERSRTWVNQPEKMYQSKTGSRWIPGQVRYGNAVYTYVPDFKSGSYKEGVVSEDEKQVTFEFQSPYVIGCTPAVMENETKTGKLRVYEDGGKNGLVVKGKVTCPVKVSVDRGATWKDAPSGSGGEALDLTDLVKGSHQYWLRFEAAPASLADAGLTIRTVCQCAQTVIPRLKDGENKITFEASGQAVVSAGPNVTQASPSIVDGKFGTPTVTLELATPRKEKAVRIYAMAHVASGSPPSDKVLYQIEYSTDGGKEWKPVVKDWKILRRGVEAPDFWSQSMCYGDVEIADATGPVRVRFSNSANKPIVRAEAHLVYQVEKNGPVDVTFAWKENGGDLKTESHSYPGTPGQPDATWTLKTGEKTECVYVEYSAK